jgi:hypothetical protein
MGTVVGYCRDQNCRRINWDGNSPHSIEAFHFKLLVKEVAELTSVGCCERERSVTPQRDRAVSHGVEVPSSTEKKP